MLKKTSRILLIVVLSSLLTVVFSSSLWAETVSINPSQDAYVRKYIPDDIYLDDSLRTGVATWSPSAAYNGGDTHAFIQFNLSGLPDTITKATLRLYSHYSQAGFYPEGVLELFVVNASWQQSSLTWNTQPSWDSAVSASVPFHINDEYVELDLTDLYGQWVNGLTNNGVMLNTSGSDEAGSCSGNGEWNCRPGMFFSSRADSGVRPVLVIEYEEEPEPTNIVIGDCDTGVMDQQYEGAWISDMISDCADQAENHGNFVSCIAELANTLKKADVISGKEMGAIVSCAAKADIP